MAGSESKKLEIDEQIDELADKLFESFSNDLQQFLADHTLVDREDIAANDWWNKILTPGNKQALIKTYVDARTNPETGVDRDSWKIIQGLGLRHLDIVEEQAPSPAESKPGAFAEEKKAVVAEAKKVLTMAAPWIKRQEEKYSDYDGQWTGFTAGFCARISGDRIIVCNFNDREHPICSSLDLSSLSLPPSFPMMDIACLLALPNGFIAIASKSKLVIDNVRTTSGGITTNRNNVKTYLGITILNLRASHEVPAYQELPTYDSPDAAVRMVADLNNPAQFIVTRTHELDQPSISLCSFDEKSKKLNSSELYSHLHHHLFSRHSFWLDHNNTRVIRSDYDPWFIDTFLGKNYAILLNPYNDNFSVAAILSNKKNHFIDASILKISLVPESGVPAKKVKFYTLTLNGFLIIRDCSSRRSLTYCEIQQKGEIAQVPVADKLPPFEAVCIAPSGEVFFVSKREIVGAITHSTISRFDPYTKTSSPIFVFKNKNIRDLVLTPDFKLGICYVGKKGGQCDFYSLPLSALEYERINTLDLFPTDVARLVLDYAGFSNPRKENTPLRDLTHPELLTFLERIRSLRADLEKRAGISFRAIDQGINLKLALEELLELLTTRADLDYDSIQAKITEKYSHYVDKGFAEYVMPLPFFVSHQALEFRKIVKDLNNLPLLAAEKIQHVLPLTVIEDKTASVDQVKSCAQQLQNLLESDYFYKRSYSAPEKMSERWNAIEALIQLIENGNKCPTSEELNQYLNQHLAAVKWGSLGYIFKQLKQAAITENPAPRRPSR